MESEINEAWIASEVYFVKYWHKSNRIINLSSNYFVYNQSWILRVRYMLKKAILERKCSARSAPVRRVRLAFTFFFSER